MTPDADAMESDGRWVSDLAVCISCEIAEVISNDSRLQRDLRGADWETSRHWLKREPTFDEAIADH
jgi:hypothetical protein